MRSLGHRRATRRAFALSNTAQRRYEAGRYDQALPLFRDALDAFRRLHHTYPTDPQRFDVHVGRELNNLGLCLAKMRRFEEAAAPLTEAAATFEILKEADERAWGGFLAGTLTTLANVLGELGRFETALDINERVVALRRGANADTGWADPDLAVALRQFAHLRVKAGRDLDHAMNAITEVQSIHAHLALESPQRYGNEVDITHMVLAELLDAMGRPDAAQRVREYARTAPGQMAAASAMMKSQQQRGRGSGV
jgi:tetratricopeptide (TPR) repeat protein